MNRSEDLYYLQESYVLFHLFGLSRGSAGELISLYARLPRERAARTGRGDLTVTAKLMTVLGRGRAIIAAGGPNPRLEEL